MQQEPFTSESLLAHFDGDRELVGELCEICLAETPSQIEAVADAVAAGGSEQVARSAHTLKGSAGAIGAVALRELAGEMEQAARRGDLTAAGGLLPALRDAWTAVERVLRSFV